MHSAITSDDIARYRRDGAVLIRRVLDADELALLEAGIEETYQAPGRHSMITGATGQGQTMVAEYVSQQNSKLRRLVMENGIVGEIAARLMETSSAQLVLDQLFYKARGPILPTPWHQDTPFLRVRGDELIRVWIPCDHSPRELTVQVLRGSHRWNVVYSASAAGRNDTYNTDPGKSAYNKHVGDPLLPPPPDVNRYRDSFDILGWTVEPGDALVFQGNMVHGAEGHPGWDRPRRALAALMGGPNLRYHAPQGKAFPVPGERDEPIPNGAPIGSYPKAFPVCWRERRPQAEVAGSGRADG